VQGSTSDGSAYHGYWAQDIYAVNTNFGSASDLVALSAALHSRGMVWLRYFGALDEAETFYSISWLMS